MSSKKIITKQGKINDYLHLIDMHEFGMRRVLSSFIAEFDDCVIIMDCGSSLDVKRIWRYLKRKDVPLSSVRYLITSHHHFDHVGGMWKLYERVKKCNPNIKILTNLKTKQLLNDSNFHMARGRRTYGDMVGVMKPIEDEAFKLIEPSTRFSNNLDELEIHETFSLNKEPVSLVIFNTPGHTPDHQSIAFIRNEEIDFIFYGEAVGTLYHSSKLLTTPTSMPIFFDHEEYMNSFRNLTKLKTPLMCGFGHFGIVNGKENVAEILCEHGRFINEFRSKVKQFYDENPKTSYVVEHLISFFSGRADIAGDMGLIPDNILLGVVYGMMMSLGYRSLEGEELSILKKYQN